MAKGNDEKAMAKGNDEKAMAKGNDEKDRKTSKMSLEMILLIALTVAILVLAVVVAFVYKKLSFWTLFSQDYVGYLQDAINSNTLAINQGLTKTKAIDLRRKVLSDNVPNVAVNDLGKSSKDVIGLIDVRFAPRFLVRRLIGR